MKNQGIINHSTAGNAFVIVLIIIALLAALTITFTRMSSNTSNDVSIEQAQAMASNVIKSARTVENAIDGLRSKGCSILEISFENPTVTGYTNAQSPADKSCWVFNVAGGGLTFPRPQTNANSGADWYFPINNSVFGVGPERETATACTANCQDLMMVLPLVDANVCKAINVATGVAADLSVAIPQAKNKFDYRYKFSAPNATAVVTNYSLADTLAGVSLEDKNTSGRAGALFDKRTGCFEAASSYEDPAGTTQTGTGKYFFYHVLIER